MRQNDIMEHRITITGTNWTIIDISLIRMQMTIDSVSAGYITATDDSSKGIVFTPGSIPVTNSTKDSVGSRIWRPGRIIIDMKNNPHINWLMSAHKDVVDRWPSVSSWFVACDEAAKRQTGIDIAFISFPSIKRSFWLSTGVWINYSRLPQAWERFQSALDLYYAAFAMVTKAYTFKQERRFEDKKNQVAVLRLIANERNMFRQGYRDIEPRCIGQTSAARDITNTKTIKTGKFVNPFVDVGVIF